MNYCHSIDLINQVSRENNLSQVNADSLLFEYDKLTNNFDSKSFNKFVDDFKSVKDFFVPDVDQFNELNDFFNTYTKDGITKFDGFLNEEFVDKAIYLFGKDNIFIWSDLDGNNFIRINKPILFGIQNPPATNKTIQNIDILFNGETEISLKQAIENLSKNEKIKPLVELLQFLYDKKRKVIIKKVKNTIKHGDKESDGLYTQYKDYDVIQIFEGAEQPGRTLTHEIIHHFTVEKIKINGDIRRELEKIMNEARRVLGEEAKDIYGLTDVYEFISEIFTNGSFIKKLNNIKGINENKPITNLINSIMDWFRKLFKLIFNEHPSLYDNAMYEIERLIYSDNNFFKNEQEFLNEQNELIKKINELNLSHYAYDHSYLKNNLNDLKNKFPYFFSSNEIDDFIIKLKSGKNLITLNKGNKFLLNNRNTTNSKIRDIIRLLNPTPFYSEKNKKEEKKDSQKEKRNPNFDYVNVNYKIDKKTGNVIFYQDQIKADEQPDYTKSFNDLKIAHRKWILKCKEHYYNEGDKKELGLVKLIDYAGSDFYVDFTDNENIKIYSASRKDNSKSFKDVTNDFDEDTGIKESIINEAINKRKEDNQVSISNKDRKDEAQNRIEENNEQEKIDNEELKLLNFIEYDKKSDTINQDSFDYKLNSWINSTNFTSAQKYEISRNIMQTLSHIINRLLIEPQTIINEIFNKTSIKLDDSIVNTLINQKVDREYIIREIGFQTLFDVIKEYYFVNGNIKGEKDRYGHSISAQKLDIINNFDAVLFCGRSTLTKLEKHKISIFGDYIPTEQEIENIYDEESNWFEELEESNNEAWQIDYDATSAIDSIKHEVINELYTIPIKKDNGKLMTKYFGMPYFEDGKTLAKIILDICHAQPTFSSMIKKLEEKKDFYPWVNSIIEFSNMDGFQAKFFSSFRKDRINRTVLTLRYDENDFANEEPIFELEELSYDFSNVTRNLQNLKSKFDVGFSSEIFSFDIEKNVTINKNALKDYTRKIDRYINKKSNLGTLNEKELNSLYFILYNLGFNLDENLVNFAGNNILTFLVSVRNLLNGLNKVKDNFEFKKTSDDLLFKKVFEELAPFMDNEKEAMQYENGKSYYAFSNPTFLSDLINKFKNIEGKKNKKYIKDIEDYYDDNFIKKSDGTFKNPVLNKLITDENFRNELKLVTHLNIEDETYNKRDVRDMTGYLDLISRMTFYFKKDRNLSNEKIKENAHYATKAYYKCGVFSNKTQSAYLYLDRIPIFKKHVNKNGNIIRRENSSFNEAMQSRFFEIMLQEIDRIKDVIQRAKNSTYQIQNRDISDDMIDELKKNGIDINEDYLDTRFFNIVKDSGAGFKYLKMYQVLLTQEYNENEPELKIFQKRLLDILNDSGETTIDELKQSFDNTIWDKHDNENKIVFYGFADDEIRIEKRFLREYAIIGESEDVYETNPKTGEFIYEKKSNGNFKYDRKGNKIKKIKYTYEKSPVAELRKISKETQDALLKDFILNNFINQCYINQLLQIDLCYTENAGDTQKRAAADVAPGVKLDTEATFSINGVIHNQRVTDGMHRSVMIKDEKVISEAKSIIKDIFSEEIKRIEDSNKKDKKATAEEMKVYLSLIETKLDAYNKYKPADGQSWVSITGVIKKLLMLGESTVEILDAYKEIVNGNFNVKNIETLTQPFKGVIKGFRHLKEENGIFNKLNIPTYIKDSEYCILLADAIIRGNNRDSMLTSIVNVMEESAYDDSYIDEYDFIHINDMKSYNGIGIDKFSMSSTQKTGLVNPLDISDKNIKKYVKENFSNELKSLKDELNDNITDDELIDIFIKDEFGSLSKAREDYIKSNIYLDKNNRKLGYNKSVVVETEFNDWRKQQEIPTHFRGHEQQWGSQERALTPMDIDPKSTFKVNGIEMSGMEIQEECMELAAKYVDLSIKELENEFGLNDSFRKKELFQIASKFEEDESIEKLISRLRRGIKNNNWNEKWAFGIDFNDDEYKNWLSERFGNDTPSNRTEFFKEKLKKPDTLGGVFKYIKDKDENFWSNKKIFKVTQAEKNAILSNLLKQEILDNDRYDTDLLKAVSLNKNGDFIVPLCEPIQAQRIQQLINSIIKNRINKQKTPGAPIVQVSSYGLNKKLHMRWYKKNSKDLLKTYDEWIKKKEGYNLYEDYVKDNRGDFAYHEIIVSVPWGDLYDKLLKPDGSLMTPEEGIAAGILTEEMLYSIGYRIPTENKCSIYPMKIVGFAPTKSGDVIILPDEIVTITGSDFDIDKTYFMFKKFDYKEGYFKTKSILNGFKSVLRANINSANDDIEKSYYEFLLDNIENNHDKYHDIIKEFNKQNVNIEFNINRLISIYKKDRDEVAVKLLEFFRINYDNFYVPSEIKEVTDMNTKEGINNRMLDLHTAILRDKKMQYLMFSPQGFDNLKRIINVVELIKNDPEDVDVDVYLNYSLEEAKSKVKKYNLGIDNENIMTLRTQTMFFVRNMNSLKLTGIFANHNTSHAFVQMANNKLPENNKIKMIYDETLRLNNIYLGDSSFVDKTPELDAIYDNKGLSYISFFLGSNVAASVDAAKDDVMTGMGISPDTANVAALLERQGFDEMFVGLFLNQPIISKIIRRFNIKRNKSYAKLSDEVDSEYVEICKKIGGIVVNGISAINAYENNYIEQNNSHLLTTRNLAIFLKDYKKKTGDKEKDKQNDLEKLKQQALVLRAFKVVLKASEYLSMIVNETKYNSIKSAVGPLIIDNLEKKFTHDDFMDLFEYDDCPFTQSAKQILKLNPLLNILYESAYGDNSITKKIFSTHFIEYSDTFYQALRLFRNTSNKNIDKKTLKKFTFDFMLFLLTEGKKPFFNQDYNHRKSNIINTPNVLNEIRSELDESGIENIFINNLFIRQNKIGFNEIETNLNGLDSVQSDLVKSDFSDLLIDLNPKIKTFAFKMLLYFLQRNGFNYSPKTGTHEIPFDVKIATGYTDAINKISEDIINNKKIINVENMVQQFYLNNSDVSKITPKISIYSYTKNDNENFIYDDEKKEFKIKRGVELLDFKAKNGEPIMAFNSKGEMFIKVDSNDNYSAIYQSANSLGQKFNYVEYNANELATSIESVINDLKTISWDGMNKKQRKEFEQNNGKFKGFTVAIRKVNQATPDNSENDKSDFDNVDTPKTTVTLLNDKEKEDREKLREKKLNKFIKNINKKITELSDEKFDFANIILKYNNIIDLSEIVRMNRKLNNIGNNMDIADIMSIFVDEMELNVEGIELSIKNPSFKSGNASFNNSEIDLIKKKINLYKEIINKLEEFC